MVKYTNLNIDSLKIVYKIIPLELELRDINPKGDRGKFLIKRLGDLYAKLLKEHNIILQINND